MSFGRGVAFVASGEGASLRVHDLVQGRVRRTTGVAYGSYNVQAGAGAVVTPSLSRGTLTILDRAGRVAMRSRSRRPPTTPASLRRSSRRHPAQRLAAQGAPIGVIRATNG